MPTNAAETWFIRTSITVAWCNAVLRLVTGVRIDVIQERFWRLREGRGQLGS